MKYRTQEINMSFPAYADFGKVGEMFVGIYEGQRTVSPPDEDAFQTHAFKFVEGTCPFIANKEACKPRPGTSLRAPGRSSTTP